jgi:hypothetical protein
MPQSTQQKRQRASSTRSSAGRVYKRVRPSQPSPPGPSAAPARPPSTTHDVEEVHNRVRPPPPLPHLSTAPAQPSSPSSPSSPLTPLEDEHFIEDAIHTVPIFDPPLDLEEEQPSNEDDDVVDPHSTPNMGRWTRTEENNWLLDNEEPLSLQGPKEHGKQCSQKCLKMVSTCR